MDSPSLAPFSGLVPPPTATSPSIFAANVLLLCFTPAILCGFFVTRYIIRPTRSHHVSVSSPSTAILSDPEAPLTKSNILTSNRLQSRLLSMIKLLTCFLLTLAGLAELVKPKQVINVGLETDIDELTQVESGGGAVEKLNDLIGWASLLSVGLMYTYLIVYLLPPSNKLTYITMTQSIPPTVYELNHKHKSLETVTSDPEDSQVFYSWIKITVFGPLTLLVITLRGILIAIGFQSDVASDYYLFIKSVRLATKMGSLILDGLILIWILVYIMMMPRGTVRYPFNWLMNSDTSSVATPGHDDFGRSPGDHQRSWAHGIDASQNRRKLARLRGSLAHVSKLTALPQASTALDLQEPTPLSHPSEAGDGRFNFGSILKSMKAAKLSISSDAAKRNSDQQVTRPTPLILHRARSYAFTAVCIFKSPVIVSQIIGIVCDLISLTSSEDRDTWKESTLMDSLVSSAIGYEGSIDYLLVVVMSLLRLYLILIEPGFQNRSPPIEYKSEKFRRWPSADRFTPAWRPSRPDEHRPWSVDRVPGSVPVTVNRSTISPPNRDSSQLGWSRAVIKSKSLGCLRQSGFNRMSESVELSSENPSFMPMKIKTSSKQIKRVPVPSHGSYPSSTSSFSLPVGSSLDLARVGSDKKELEGLSWGSSKGSSSSGFAIVTPPERSITRGQSAFNPEHCTNDQAIVGDLASRAVVHHPEYAALHSAMAPFYEFGTTASQELDRPVSKFWPRTPSNDSSGIYPTSDRYTDHSLISSNVSSYPGWFQPLADSDGTFNRRGPSGQEPRGVSYSLSPNLSAGLTDGNETSYSALTLNYAWSSHSNLLRQLQDELGLNSSSASESGTAGHRQESSPSTVHPADQEVSGIQSIYGALGIQTMPKRIAPKSVQRSTPPPSPSIFSLREVRAEASNSNPVPTERTLLEVNRHTLTSIDENEEFVSHHETEKDEIYSSEPDTDLTKTPVGRHLPIEAVLESEDSDARKNASDAGSDPFRYEKISDLTESGVEDDSTTPRGPSESSCTESKSNPASKDPLKYRVFDSPEVSQCTSGPETSFSDLETSFTSHSQHVDDVFRLHRKLSDDHHSTNFGKPGSPGVLLNFSSLPNSPTSRLIHASNQSEDETGNDDYECLVSEKRSRNLDSNGSERNHGSSSSSAVMSELGILGYSTDEELDQLIGGGFSVIRRARHTVIHSGRSYESTVSNHSSGSQGRGITSGDEAHEHERDNGSKTQSSSHIGPRKRTVSSLLTGSVSQAGQLLGRRVATGAVLKNVPLLSSHNQKRSSQESFCCAGEHVFDTNVRNTRALGIGSGSNSTSADQSEQEAIESLTVLNPSDGPLTHNFDFRTHHRSRSEGKLRSHSTQGSLSSISSRVSTSETFADDRDTRRRKQVKIRKFLDKNPFSRSSFGRTPKSRLSRRAMSDEAISAPWIAQEICLSDLSAFCSQDERVEGSSTEDSLGQIWEPETNDGHQPTILDVSLDVPRLNSEIEDHEPTLSPYIRSGSIEHESELEPQAEDLTEDRSQGFQSTEIRFKHSLKNLAEAVAKDEESGDEFRCEVISSPSEKGLPQSDDSMPPRALSTTSTDSGEWDPFGLELFEPLPLSPMLRRMSLERNNMGSDQPLNEASFEFNPTENVVHESSRGTNV